MANDGKQTAATFCMIVSAWAVPLLAFFGILCIQESHMIELPTEQKKDAAWGCFGSAILYALTFFGAFTYKSKLQQASARDMTFMQMQEMQQVTERNRT
mmetsp:Transcript_21038/g.44857  ORF Transcript_21038/g.44857 Transcript_21038/m.44857 type:complete len:99 (-) Transcript_21038:102-398(-)